MLKLSLWYRAQGPTPTALNKLGIAMVLGDFMNITVFGATKIARKRPPTNAILGLRFLIINYSRKLQPI
jgi:hypothetical protein